jgi:hypothetical protein
MTARTPIPTEHEKTLNEYIENRKAREDGKKRPYMANPNYNKMYANLDKLRDVTKCDHPIEGCKEPEYCPTCANATFRGKIRCVGGFDHTFKRNGRGPIWEDCNDDELKFCIDQPHDPEDYDKKNLRGICDRDRDRRKLQNRLKRKAAELTLVANKGKKPCRMKACGGVTHAHGEKCPTMAALGKRGGKGGTGASKARKGAKNGRSKGGPKKRTQTAARLKSGEIKIQTGPVETTDPFDYYRKNLDKGANE